MWNDILSSSSRARLPIVGGCGLQEIFPSNQRNHQPLYLNDHKQLEVEQGPLLHEQESEGADYLLEKVNNIIKKIYSDFKCGKVLNVPYFLKMSSAIKLSQRECHIQRNKEPMLHEHL